MKSRLARVCAALTCAVAATVAAGTSASASVPPPKTHALVCEFAVETTGFTPMYPYPQPGGSGWFSAPGSGTCAGELTGPVSVSVSGSYSTITCGTGTATADFYFQDGRGAGLPVHAEWTFAAFQGPMVLSGPGSGAGSWHWYPNVGGCVTGPVLDFVAYGDLALETLSVG